MASIERTAYPRLNKRMSDEELCAGYELTDRERRFIDMNANGGRQRLTLTTLLKTRQRGPANATGQTAIASAKVNPSGPRTDGIA